MNVNKKFDRLKKWGKERMGGDAKTDTSDDFKMLEAEMQIRHEGMELLKRSADVYVKSISKREKHDNKELQLPVAYLGSSMADHGEDFESDSEFGQCLTVLGRANERIARVQETYSANATSSWLESLERSLVQAKELQAARKKLENRRLAFDTASAKIQKAKKEDSRMEEELRLQKMKYEESNEDVFRRMVDIKEAEADSILDLTTFLEAQLTYYDRCREILVQVKNNWPAGGSASLSNVTKSSSTTPPATAQSSTTNRSSTSSPVNGGLMRRLTRSRASSMNDRYSRLVEGDPVNAPPRPPRPRVPSGQNSPQRELPGFDLPSRTTIHGRSFSSGGRQQQAGGSPQDGIPLLSRMNTEPGPAVQSRSGLHREQARPDRTSSERDTFADDQSTDLYNDSDVDDDNEDDETIASSFPGYAHERPSASFLTTYGQHGGATTASANGVPSRRGPPPPPPPSRSKKPPPPLPLKRSALSTSEVPRY